jgi:ABC-type Mn2+/Zn2+ transport system ATPase subunit
MMGVVVAQVRGFSFNEFRFALSDDPTGETAEGNRFTVVIGKNGAGKSRLLRALRDWAANPDNGTFLFGRRSEFKQVLAVSNLVSDVFPFSEKPRSPATTYRYLGLRQNPNMMTTGSLGTTATIYMGACVLDPQKMDRLAPALRAIGASAFRIMPPPGTLRIDRESVRSSRNRLKAQDLDPSVDVTGLDQAVRAVLEQAAFEQADSRFERGSIWMQPFLDIAHEYSVPLPEILGLARRQMRVDFDTRVRIGDKWLDLGDLSTGQLLLLSTCARLAATIENDSLVLIDEPEIGLHPAWQADFISLLKHSTRGATDCHFFVATHSPHLVSDASDVLVPGQEWGSFDEFDDPFYGRSVENILYRVFETSTLGNPLVERDLTALFRVVSESTLDRSTLIVADQALSRLRTVAGADTLELNRLLDRAAEVLGELR